MESELSSGAQAMPAAVVSVAVTDVPENEVMTELQRVLGSPRFAHSRRLCRFLRFIVEQALHVGRENLKEYVLGVEVFDRGIQFDPRMDPIVRVEARRLRMKLRQYYKSEGRNDPIHIGFAKGGYGPVFRKKGPRNKRRAVLPHITLSLDLWKGNLSAAIATALESRRSVTLNSAATGLEAEVVPLLDTSGKTSGVDVRLVRTRASAPSQPILAEQIEELRAAIQQLTARLEELKQR